MKGLEMMLANLLGMKPDEMRSKVETAVNLMEQGANAAAQIQSDLAKIKAHLGIDEPIIEERDFVNGGRAIANGGSDRIQL